MIANGLGTVPSLARMHRKLTALVDIRKLTEDYNLEYSRVVTTKALTANPIIGHKAIATKHLTRGGRKAEYTVYEATDRNWPVYDYVRGWWEMPSEGGQLTGRFVFLLKQGEYDASVDYWPK